MNRITLLQPWLLTVLWAAGCTDGRVPDRVACSDCQIVIEEIATIGSADGRASLTGRPTDVHVDGIGRYWVSVLDAFPLIFDSTTVFLQQFGRPGEGPGEFRMVRVLATLPGDSVLVSSFPHHHVIGPDLNVSRTIRGSPHHQLGQLKVVAWPKVMFAATSSFDRTSRRSTNYIVRYDLSSDSVLPQDTIMKVEATGSDGTAYANSIRILGETTGGGDLWVAHLNRYRLLRLGRSGEVLNSLERDLDWFRGGEPMVIGGPEMPTNPRVMTVWTDEHGLLWALVAKPRQNTKAAWKGVNIEGGEARVASLPADYELNETLIEVIDPVGKRVVARLVFDGYITSVLQGNRVTAFQETEQGIPIVSIYELRMTGTYP